MERRLGRLLKDFRWGRMDEVFLGSGHRVTANAENVSRCRQDRFPDPGPLPEGEGGLGRPARDLHGKESTP
jgi:hypothetical protein